MRIKIGNFEFTEVWDGVLYKKLSNYPHISDWELRNIMEFISYEEANGRDCIIECDHEDLLNIIYGRIQDKARYMNAPRPSLITECTACPYRKGCETAFVCHTTSVENAVSIFASGKLLSAVKARNISAELLMAEERNAAKDPADYFEYVMLAWGNCQAGDRLVMERKLGRFPNAEDLSTHFEPGIRFYFRYEDMAKHPNAVFDGVLPMKIKDEIDLQKYVCLIVVPSEIRAKVESNIPDCLQSRVVYIENDCKDIWDWSEKVYRIVETREKS